MIAIPSVEEWYALQKIRFNSFHYSNALLILAEFIDDEVVAFYAGFCCSALKSHLYLGGGGRSLTAISN